MGEDRGRTEREVSRDRPGDEMVRVDVAEAAHGLGISEAGVRKRVQRGQMPHERGDDGRLYVWISPGETRQAASRDEAEMSRDTAQDAGEREDRTAELIATLREQLAAERRANEENRRIIAALTQRIPEVEAPREPSGATEPPEPPTQATEQPGRVEPQLSVEAADEAERAGRVAAESAMRGGRLRRSWWRRMFGG